jgi:hypothetical protein
MQGPGRKVGRITSLLRYPRTASPTALLASSVRIPIRLPRTRNVSRSSTQPLAWCLVMSPAANLAGDAPISDSKLISRGLRLKRGAGFRTPTSYFAAPYFVLLRQGCMLYTEYALHEPREARLRSARQRPIDASRLRNPTYGATVPVRRAIKACISHDHSRPDAPSGKREHGVLEDDH